MKTAFMRRHNMFTRAFIEQKGNGKLGCEEQLLASELSARGISITLFTVKKIQRRQLALSRETFIAGGMDVMHGAMQQLGIEVPQPADYPDSLQPYLRRRIWKSTLGVIEQRILDGDSAPVFVKPAERRKNFTGRIFATIDDFRVIGDVSRRQPVWCSEVVAWASEYRVYVVKHEIGAVKHYGGDTAITPDLQVIEAALAAYRAAGSAPAAYGIDFGVLATGETALVEANDGYSLGAYELSGVIYTDLLLTRWAELISTIK